MKHLYLCYYFVTMITNLFDINDFSNRKPFNRFYFTLITLHPPLSIVKLPV